MTQLGRGLAALGTLLALAASAAPVAARSTLADDTVLLALQQTIQHSNDEQVQAIASGDLSLVSDTVTGNYAQQLTSSLQDMLDHHVTGITLLNLQWGPITVAADGSSAAVTTYETWQVATILGSVDYMPTRNDYTVALQNSMWKIQSDAQSVGAPTPLATSTPIPTPTPSPTSTVTPTVTPTPLPTDTPTPLPTNTPTPEASDASE